MFYTLMKKLKITLKENSIKLVETLYTVITAVYRAIPYYEITLIEASAGGHTAIVDLLLEKGADINQRDSYDKTALIEASANGHTEIVALLLAKGATISQKNKWGETSLMWALIKGHINIAKLLLNAGADVNQTDNDGNTALMVVVNFLEFGFPYVEFFDNSGVARTTIENYSTIGYYLEKKLIVKQAIEFLLDRGADINHQNEQGETALMVAVMYGYKAIVDLLLKRGADSNRQNEEGETALMVAVKNGSTVLVDLLLVKGAADVNQQNNEGKTALMLALAKGHKMIVVVLLNSGADVNQIDHDGNTALILSINFLAFELSNLEFFDNSNIFDSIMDNYSNMIYYPENEFIVKKIILLLLNYGADVNQQNNYGETALIRASASGLPEVVKLLLAKGAVVNRGDRYTTLMMAAVNGHKKTVEYLLRAGIEANFKTGIQTVLWVAHSPEIAKIILECALLIDLSTNLERSLMDYPELIQYGIACKKELNKTVIYNKSLTLHTLLTTDDYKFILNNYKIVSKEKDEKKEIESEYNLWCDISDFSIYQEAFIKCTKIVNRLADLEHLKKLTIIPKYELPLTDDALEHPNASHPQVTSKAWPPLSAEEREPVSKHPGFEANEGCLSYDAIELISKYLEPKEISALLLASKNTQTVIQNVSACRGDEQNSSDSVDDPPDYSDLGHLECVVF